MQVALGSRILGVLNFLSPETAKLIMRLKSALSFGNVLMKINSHKQLELLEIEKKNLITFVPLHLSQKYANFIDFLLFCLRFCDGLLVYFLIFSPL